MLRLILHYSRRASETLREGATLKALLATSLDEQLLRLREVRPAEMEATATRLMREIDATLKGLEVA